MELEPGEAWEWRIEDFGYRFEWIEPGVFSMGSPSSEAERQGDEKLHQVEFRQGFWMGSTEVTQALWVEMMGDNPSQSQTSPMLPVEMASWEDAARFCRRATAFLRENGMLDTEWEVNLPTEAQWEWACRAGSENAFAEPLDRIACYLETSEGCVRPVASRQPNAWGLYDLHGNLWEWCRDWRGDYPEESVVDPVGPEFGVEKILRGGAWYLPARYLRSANRFGNLPDYRDNSTGFRIVIERVRD